MCELCSDFFFFYFCCFRLMLFGENFFNDFFVIELDEWEVEYGSLVFSK